MDAVLLCVLMVSVCVSVGQPTTQGHCPYGEDNCDGIPHIVQAHEANLRLLGQKMGDVLSWKEEIQNQHNKEVAELKEEITTLKNYIVKLNETKQDIYTNCADVQKSVGRKSGVYTLTLTDALHRVYHVPVYCDMNTTTGGWTVFQRRQDGSVPFNKNWEQYKNGFGDLQGEFWLGNEWISMMTASQTRYTLRIDLESFDNEKRYAKYTNFTIGNEAEKYKLNIGSYSGTAGDAGTGLSYHNGMKFTTKDEDNDKYSSGNCAMHEGGDGGFWYKTCQYVTTNGVYRHTAVDDYNGINWYAWLKWTTLKHMEMKFKPMI